MKFSICKIIKHFYFIFLGIFCVTSTAFAVFDATLIGDPIPAEMHPGEIRRVEVTMQNTGDEAWIDIPFRLQSITTPEDRWGNSLYPLDGGETINPTESKTFIVYLEAPITPGTYESQWQMKNNTTPELFGEIILDNIWVDASVIPEWDAAIISHDLPTEMFPGEPRLVTVTVENTGAGDWTGDRFALTAYNNTPPLLWDTPLFFNLGETETVAPGEQRTFTFLIAAPSPPTYPEGSYDCVWQMVHIHAYTYFGEILTQSVNVSSSLVTPELGASLQSHTIPSDMYPSETRPAAITFQNTGTTTWDENNMRLYAPTSTWGSNRVYLLDSGETVAQGESKTFTVILTAPATEGTYDCDWSLQGVWNIDGANQFKPFGDEVSEPINVNNAVTPFLNAAVVSHTIPSQMTASEVVSVDVTYENTGSGTWDGSDPLWIRLRTQNSPTGLWDTYNVNLDVSDYIEPGQTKTFTFNITAPAADGPYNCRWQLQKQWPGSTSLFGALLDVPVQVGTVTEVCGNGIVEVPEECDDGNTEDGDCCSASCTYEALDSPCGDPADTDCTAPDTCDGAGVCNDNHLPDTTSCQDGLYCTDGDTCDGSGICQPGIGDPCAVGEVCDEINDECDPTEVCGNGIVEVPEECDDGNTEDGDCCSASCTYEALDSPCGDPADTDCTAPDTCDGAGVCNDNHLPDTTSCQDGLYCTDGDTCDGSGICQPGTGDPCAPDLCDDDLDVCVELGDFDEDGVPDISDNCPQTPNGPLLGTCIYGLVEGTCMTNEECGLNGFCSMNQEDNYPPPSGNGLGDACECEGDFDCDGDVDGSDANLFKRDFGRSILKNPCPNCQ